MKSAKNAWPKGPTVWIEDMTLYVSIPFTWNLPMVKGMLRQYSFEWNSAIVGGPATYLVPDFFDDMPHVEWKDAYPGVLQKINPIATRTTMGCVRHCKFCVVHKTEGVFRELSDWPDLPIICDNNILAASDSHFDRVVNRLLKHRDVDFNQGIDHRLLTDYHVKRLAEIKSFKSRGLRLALDDMRYSDTWGAAFERLQAAGIAKRNIGSYALIGYNSDPSEAWARCKWIEKHGIKVFPMWFHSLKQLQKNIVTRDQEALGWNDYERRRIMQWFYQHKKVAQ